MTILKTHIKNEKRWKKSICKFLKCNNFDLNKVPEHKYATSISHQPENSQMLETAFDFIVVPQIVRHCVKSL